MSSPGNDSEETTSVMPASDSSNTVPVGPVCRPPVPPFRETHLRPCERRSLQQPSMGRVLEDHSGGVEGHRGHVLGTGGLRKHDVDLSPLVAGDCFDGQTFVEVSKPGGGTIRFKAYHAGHRGPVLFFVHGAGYVL